MPKGIIATGWPAVEKKCHHLGIHFQSWQTGVGTIILGKRADGKYGATIGGSVISIPRQVGKTFLVGAIVFALCLLNPGMTVIWTAHRLRTAGETFDSMRGMARRAKIRPLIDRVVLGSGEEEVRFKNGSRILFGARERGFGRGFDEVDVLIFDEAQILTDNAIDDMVPATNQCRQPAGALLLFMGTPPKPTDPGDVFRRKREECLSGEDEDTAYIEFSADPDAKSDDFKQIAKANPSYPTFTPRESVLRMRKNLTPESFTREGLGIWDDINVGGVFGRGVWARRSTLEPPPAPAALGIAADLDQTVLSLGAASVPIDRSRQGTNEVIPVRHLGSVLSMPNETASAEFVAEVKRIQGEYAIPVVIDDKGPASFLIPQLEEAEVWLKRINLDDLVQACADLCAAVDEGTVEHGNYADLNDAVDAAGWRPVGTEGARRAFARKSGDISSLEAVTLALAGATVPAPTIW